MNEYVLLKLKGNWIEKEEAFGFLKMFMNTQRNIEIANDQVVIVNAEQNIPKEEIALYGEDLIEYAKHNIPKEIGLYLEENGLIQYQEESKEGFLTLRGTVFVIKAPKTEKAKGGLL